MTLTLEQKERFLRAKSRGAVRRAILNQIKKEKGIVFGARAVNRQVPKHLESPTEDFDVFIPKGKSPKKTAKRIERRLDKKFGGNFFKVEEGKFEGLYKVKSRVSGKGLIDLNKQKQKVGVVKRKGVKFADLQFQKKKIKESLANPEAKFRRDKDKFSRLRIKIAEARKKKRKRSIKRTKRTLVSRRRLRDLDIPKFDIAKF